MDNGLRMKSWFSVKLFLGWGHDAAIGAAFNEQNGAKILAILRGSD
jgi:hypothetical protein